MEWIAALLVFVGVAVLMEGVAWATHRYVMHGSLWTLHADHHRPSGRGLQRNDAFSLFFAALAIVLIAGGTLWWGSPLAVAAGAGMTLYGLGYFLFHDVMFHRRVRRLNLKPTTRYLRRMVAAHREHHRRSGQAKGEAFGFLYAPARYDVG